MIRNASLVVTAVVELVRARFIVASRSEGEVLDLLRNPPAGNDTLPLSRRGSERAKTVGWAVGGIARRAPFRADCLVRTLVGQRMLAREGVEHRVRLQVGKDPSGATVAHCWIECDGEAVIGAPIKGYEPLPL